MDDAKETMYLQQAAEQHAGNLRQIINLQLKIRELTEEVEMLRLQVQDRDTQSVPPIQHAQESHPDDVA